jgi:PPOX class probable F420-dependent enzyme
VELDTAMTFVRSRDEGVLATHRPGGRPQMSNIYYAVSDGAIQISVTADRHKTRHMRRDPRASLHVTSPDFRSWAVLDCRVSLGPIAHEPGDSGISDLVSLYRLRKGEHPDWSEFEQAMITQRRLVVSLHPEHAYGQRI